MLNNPNQILSPESSKASNPSPGYAMWLIVIRLKNLNKA